MAQNQALKDFDDLPDSAFVRLPTVAALFACHGATIWRRVGSGDLPQPVHLGPRSTAWRVGDLRAKLAALAEAA